MWRPHCREMARLTCWALEKEDIGNSAPCVGVADQSGIAGNNYGSQLLEEPNEAGGSRAAVEPQHEWVIRRASFALY